MEREGCESKIGARQRKSCTGRGKLNAGCAVQYNFSSSRFIVQLRFIAASGNRFDSACVQYNFSSAVPPDMFFGCRWAYRFDSVCVQYIISIKQKTDSLRHCGNSRNDRFRLFPQRGVKRQTIFPRFGQKKRLKTSFSKRELGTARALMP